MTTPQALFVAWIAASACTLLIAALWSWLEDLLGGDGVD